MAELASTAKGWHGVQLAVLAFIGLCGVLSEGDPGNPRWLDVTSGVLAIAALVLACVAVFLVATVAWPITGGGTADDDGSPDSPVQARAARRLRQGVALTFLAVAVMATAASANWWPTEDAAEPPDADAGGVAVGITDRQGRLWCGNLVDAPTGAIRVATASGTVEIAVTNVVDITQVDAC
jgi:hypothetical protein